MRKHKKTTGNGTAKLRRRGRRGQPLANWLHAIHENPHRNAEVHAGLDLDQLRRSGIAPPEPPHAKLESVLRILHRLAQRLQRP